MENLDLFTPVEQGLPDSDGPYVVLIENGKTSFFSKYESGKWVAYFNQNKMIVTPTHWLDLSKLTTKEKAEYVAKEAYQIGWGDCDNKVEYKPMDAISDLIKNSIL